MNEDIPITGLQVYEYSLCIYYTLEKMIKYLQETKEELINLKQYETLEKDLRDHTDQIMYVKIRRLEDYLEDLKADSFALKEVKCE